MFATTTFQGQTRCTTNSNDKAGNNISADGAHLLSEVMKVNTTLTTLNMEGA